MLAGWLKAVNALRQAGVVETGGVLRDRGSAGAGGVMQGMGLTGTVNGSWGLGLAGAFGGLCVLMSAVTTMALFGLMCVLCLFVIVCEGYLCPPL